MTTSNSSYSHQKEDGQTTEAILSLGKLIAEHLDEHDLLSRWMAHHLAARLEALDSLEGKERADAEESAAGLVLQIWERRQGARFTDDPLALADSVRRAVARLDPAAKGPFAYYRSFDEKPGPTNADVEANTALKLALLIDDAAGDLVHSLVRYAAQIAMDRDAQWVEATQAVGQSTLRDLTRIMSYSPEEAVVGQDPIDSERRQIMARAKALSKVLKGLAGLEEPTP